MEQKMALRVPIFVSSPGDVQPEREAVKQVIDTLNQRENIRQKYILEARLYEGEVPPIAGSGSAQETVNQYMLRPEEAYLMICLFWSRMGTPFYDPATQKKYMSGTLYEFTMAYQARQTQGSPHLLVYRKLPFNPQADSEQTSRVGEFFKRFEGDNSSLQGLYKVFTELDDFKHMLERHIDKVLIEHPPEAKELKEYQTTIPATYNNTISITGNVQDSVVTNGITNSTVNITNNGSPKRSQ